jgi:hypothetical protein
MDVFHDDRFTLFLRLDRGHTNWPISAEKPLATCASYEEARRLQREYQKSDHKTVIRYVGEAGGGD